MQRFGSGSRSESDENNLLFPIGVTVNETTGHIIACSNRSDVVKIFDWDTTLKFTLGGGRVRIKSQFCCKIKKSWAV